MKNSIRFFWNKGSPYCVGNTMGLGVLSVILTSLHTVASVEAFKESIINSVKSNSEYRFTSDNGTFCMILQGNKIKFCILEEYYTLIDMWGIDPESLEKDVLDFILYSESFDLNFVLRSIDDWLFFLKRGRPL